MLTAPGPNEDVRLLWRQVAEAIEVLNAIQNMTVVVEGRVKMLGKLKVAGSSSKLEIKEARETAS